MKRNIFLLLFFFPVVLYAQDNSEIIKISGLVLDKKNNEPLAFVNIGIINRNIGTISYENGSFELAIPVQHANDELTFSMVGYKVLTIPINDIIGKMDTLFLEESPIPIAEAKIVLGKSVRKKVGTRIHSPVLNTDNYHEVAHKIESGVYPVKLEDVNIYFHVRESDTATIRLSIYREVDNRPDTFPIVSQIYHLDTSNGWHKIDLKQENIVMDDNFYVGVFLLPSYRQKKKSIINYGITLVKKGDCFIREGILGKWENIESWNYSIYSTLLYSKNKN